MMMKDQAIVREKVTDEAERRAVYEILVECDEDFVPPLSFRAGTRQTDWTHKGATQEGVRDYFETVMQQHVLLWKRGEEILGFMSFRPHEITPHLEEFGRVCYLSTLCVRHACRGQGLSPKIYRVAQEWAWEHGGEITVLRTWSTNAAQMHLMEKLGYVEKARLVNDRGEGVDTVYYVHER